MVGFPHEKCSAAIGGGLAVEAYLGEGVITGADYKNNLFKHNVHSSRGQSGGFIYLRCRPNNLIFGLHILYNK